MKIIFAFIVLWLASDAAAQIRYHQNGETITHITGTSTLHDWSMTSKRASYDVVLEVSESGVPTTIQALSFAIDCETLKSGHSALDRNAYSTLNTDAFKKITFEMTSGRVTDQQIQCTGNLTIMGTTKQVSITAQFKTLPSGAISCTATQRLKMSEFGVDPPVFMFGTIRTDDEITVSIQVTLAAR